MASGAAFVPQPFMTMYSATKAYVDFFSRSLSYECSDIGITVQSVCSGKVSVHGVESFCHFMHGFSLSIKNGPILLFYITLD